MKELCLLPLLGMIFLMSAGALEPPPDEPADTPLTASPSDPAGHPADGAVRTRPSALRHVYRIAAAAVLAVVLFSVIMLLFEDRFIFIPSRRPLESWKPAGLPVEECTFRTQDGLNLYAWWHPGADPAEPSADADASHRPVLLWCHGNAGNITHRQENLEMLAEMGLAVLLFDYRGYGRSDGRPSERGFYMDGEAACRWLVKERGVAPGRIICFGRSLGSTVALHVALRKKVAGVILESPFESAPAMAGRVVPVLPLGFFMRNRFDNLGRVEHLKVPVLVLHGDRDEIIPFEQGRAVYEAAREPKEFYVIRNAGHNDTYLVGGTPYFRKISEFCHRCVSGGSGGPG